MAINVVLSNGGCLRSLPGITLLGRRVEIRAGQISIGMYQSKSLNSVGMYQSKSLNSICGRYLRVSIPGFNC